MAAPRPQRGYATISSHLYPRRRFGRKGRAKLFAFVSVLLLIVLLILAPGIRVSSQGKRDELRGEEKDSSEGIIGAVGGLRSVFGFDKEDLDEDKEGGDESESDFETTEKKEVGAGNESVHVGAEEVEKGNERKAVDVDVDVKSVKEDDALVPATANISVVVLFHNEYPTLEHTLKSWDKNGLYDYVSEVLFFMNGMQDKGDFLDRLSVLKEDRWRKLVRTEYSEKNLKLGVAITRMVEMANWDNVLLLEKDWALIENKEETGKALRNGARLLEEQVADVVRYRHRDRPGAPLHARIMHEGREPSMLTGQKNLFCFAHHWVKQPAEKYPEFFSKCTDKKEDEETWCSKAKYCQWTNNPAMFRKHWFKEWLGGKYMKLYNELIGKNPNDYRLDFEYFTYWTPGVWNERDFTVALPKGLFEHDEIGEQNIMNTVWYGWNRLRTDVHEKRGLLLESEVNQCDKKEKSLDSGLKISEKYPLKFVRMYHFDQAMQKSVDEGVAEIEKESLRLQKQLENGEGTWRNGITDLTNLWYKISLYSWPEEPEEMKITFVTSLYVTGGETEVGKWKVERVGKNLNKLRNYRLVVYCSKESEESLQRVLKEKHEWDEKRIEAIEFNTRELNETMTSLMGSENVERIRKAYSSEEWKRVVKERSDGVLPSAEKLMLNIAKPYFLHDASMRNNGGTHYLWFDAVSRCLDKAQELDKRNDHVIRGMLMLHALISGIKIKTPTEVNGMLVGSGIDKEVWWKEMEMNEDKVNNDGFILADFKTLGGSRLAVSLMKGYYDLVLRYLLRKGQVGCGREAMSIAYKNVNYNFKLFESNQACRRNDDSCGGVDRIDAVYATEDGEWGCKLFMWAGSCTI